MTKILKKIITSIKELKSTPKYNIIEVYQDDDGDHFVKVKHFGKHLIESMDPIKILSDDQLTDSFSQRDVRTLTFLGYLSQNNPKYQILAQRISKDKKIVFAIKKKGSNTVSMKSADEVYNDKDIISNLNHKDAHDVGYVKGLQKEQELQNASNLKNIVNEEKTMPVHKSHMMDILYGEPLSSAVYDRCESLSSDFNTLVQSFVYDVFWAREGLTLQQKSLATIISLVVLSKAEQLNIHLKGFINKGNQPKFIITMLNYMTTSNYIHPETNKLAISQLNTVARELGVHVDKNLVPLSSHEQAFIDFASHIALGNNTKTKVCISNILQEKLFSPSELENIMIHQMVYCGFPCAMNGLAVMKELL